jgi:ubiquinone/menaquinone biosynthesis C-methylase UbiE
VDVIISNCVINLSGDTGRVLAEAFRVLKPGGRFAVSDIVTGGEIPMAIREQRELWPACIAGALSEAGYRAKLAAARFDATAVEPTRLYAAADAQAMLLGSAEAERPAEAVDGRFMSAFVRARKPGQ